MSKTEKTKDGQRPRVDPFGDNKIAEARGKSLIQICDADVQATWKD